MAKAKAMDDVSSGGSTVGGIRGARPVTLAGHLTNACVALLFSFLAIYALGSYIAWDPNPGHWTADGRMIGAIISVIGCVLLFFGLERR